MAKNTENSDRELPEHDYHPPRSNANRNGLTPEEVAEGGAHLDVHPSELRWNSVGTKSGRK